LIGTMAMRAAGATSYREFGPPPGLADDLLCSWIGNVGPEGPPSIDRVLPDGCVDVVWNGERLFVTGPDETAVPTAGRARKKSFPRSRFRCYDPRPRARLRRPR